LVPYPFVGTKAITHALLHPSDPCCEGWSEGFAGDVREVVLLGFTAFTPDHARIAGRRLLQLGRVRVKRTSGIGGRGQYVAASAGAIDDALQEIDVEEIVQCGVVLEQDLARVTTCSVGQVRVAGLVASYCGTQRLTPNNHGVQVYGGSELLVVRGDYDVLLAVDLDPGMRLAVRQACVYERAALRRFGLCASRRNYDVAQGLDGEGRWCSGVLEQSWRIGGASGAEIVALEAFRSRPDLNAVRASCVEIYGACDTLPPGAVVYYRGVDEHVGMLTKYALVDA
jgi:hypothetical protein